MMTLKNRSLLPARGECREACFATGGAAIPTSICAVFPSVSFRFAQADTLPSREGTR